MSTHPLKKPLHFPLCEEHGYPMVKIDGQLQCVGECLDWCILGEEIVDVVMHDKATAYVFESGHELPLLCFCCGSPLEGATLEETKKEMIGRRFEMMYFTFIEDEEEGEVPYFIMEFSKKGWFSKGFQRPYSPLIAAQMKHPLDCPYRPVKKRRAKKKR